MAIFDHSDYKQFVVAELEQRPQRGRGEFSRIAKALDIHTTMVTHIFRGDSHLSPEQTLALGEYFGLNDLETEYLVALVQLARAGDHRTRTYFTNRVRELKEKSLAVQSRLEIKNALDESDQAVFYSSWMYAAIRLLTAVPQKNSAAEIAGDLGLPLPQTNRALEFLVSRGLVTRESGKLSYREFPTYVGRESPFVARHHMNWRLKALERMESLDKTEIVYTFPVVIARADFEKISEMVMRFIADFRKTTNPSPSEELCYFGIDWMKVTGR